MITIKECKLADLNELRELSISTFIDTYASVNTKENMDDYISNAFNVKRLEQELVCDDVSFYFLYQDKKLAGYVRLNEGAAQTEHHDLEAIEVERIYVKKEFQGNGLGKQLMENVIQIAHQKGKAFVWLGVWEENEKAIAFYKSCGFVNCGQHAFTLGDEEQIDYIMKRDVEQILALQ